MSQIYAMSRPDKTGGVTESGHVASRTGGAGVVDILVHALFAPSVRAELFEALCGGFDKLSPNG
jgi:hypothetical protein